MSDSKDAGGTPAEADLLKGLARLEKLAKGQVTGKLPGNNEPKGTWAYGAEPDEVTDADSDVSGDSGEEERDGKKSDTEYRPKPSPVRKAMGQKDDDGGAGEGDEDENLEGDDDLGDDDEDDEDDEDDSAGAARDDKRDDDRPADKSLAARARRSRTLKKGVEVSPFLRAFVRSISKALSSLERRSERRLRLALDKSEARRHRFEKGLTEVLSGLSAVAIEQGDLLKALSAQPARGPKSQTHAVRAVQKSFEGPGDDQITLPDGSTAPQLERATVMQRLLNGVAKGLIGSGEVVKFETTGIVHPALYKSLVHDERFAK